MARVKQQEASLKADTLPLILSSCTVTPAAWDRWPVLYDRLQPRSEALQELRKKALLPPLPVEADDLARLDQMPVAMD
eukprot:9780281-Lingulodinium_polyedra.AAC.1